MTTKFEDMTDEQWIAYSRNTSFKAAACNGDLERCRRLLQEGGININYRSGDTKKTALYSATVNYREDVCRFLLSHGADPNIKNAFGFCPLDVHDGWLKKLL